MHALLAHAYHLAQHILAHLLNPQWRAFAATLGFALAARALNFKNAAFWAVAACIAGWSVLASLAPAQFPPAPIARLTGLGLALAAYCWLPTASQALRWAALACLSLFAAWWLRGAPLTPAGFSWCLPAACALGLLLPLTQYLARIAPSWATPAAALILTTSLAISGAAPHWANAALIPGLAALAWRGQPNAPPAMAAAIALVATTALNASNQGRVLPIDATCLLPLLAWPLAIALRRRPPQQQNRLPD